MRIAFTGVHGVGKTTLLKEMKKDPKFSDYVFCDEITRSLVKNGTKINERGDSMTQLQILNAHIKNLNWPNSIMDRCILDGYIYTGYLYGKGQTELWVLQMYKNLLKRLLQEYDIIFYIEPEFELEDDGVRSTSDEFQRVILDGFRRILTLQNIPQLVKLTGTVEERMKQIHNEITKYEQSR